MNDHQSLAKAKFAYKRLFGQTRHYHRVRGIKLMTDGQPQLRRDNDHSLHCQSTLSRLGT
jgi:hypothetical protein